MFGVSRLEIIFLPKDWPTYLTKQFAKCNFYNSRRQEPWMKYPYFNCQNLHFLCTASTEKINNILAAHTTCTFCPGVTIFLFWHQFNNQSINELDLTEISFWASSKISYHLVHGATTIDSDRLLIYLIVSSTPKKVFWVRKFDRFFYQYIITPAFYKYWLVKTYWLSCFNQILRR
jgi:hypothetical protein